MPDPTPTILVVEDDEKLAVLMWQLLERSGYHVAVEHRGDRAIDAILAQQPQLVILDVNLPGRDGFAVCREVQGEFAGRILMITARDQEIDELVGLEAGADDFLVKPVGEQRLLARVRALLRRGAKSADRSTETDPRVETGDLSIDPQNRTVSLGGLALRMSTTEFELLWILASHLGQPVSRDGLFEALHGREYDGVDRSIDLKISRLRRILGDDPNAPRWIKTVRGQGYMLARYR